jgi:hypothetical protein
MTRIVGGGLSQFHDDENDFELLLSYADGREVGFSISRDVAQRVGAELVKESGGPTADAMPAGELVEVSWLVGRDLLSVAAADTNLSDSAVRQLCLARSGQPSEEVRAWANRVALATAEGPTE